MEEVSIKEGFLEEKVYRTWRSIFPPKASLQSSLLVPTATCYITLPSFSPLGQVSSSPPILLLRNGFKEEE